MQLRTEVQDLWANLTERCSARVDPGLKYGDGPVAIRRVLERLSERGAKLDEVRAMHAVLATEITQSPPGLQRNEISRTLASLGDEIQGQVAEFRHVCDDFVTAFEGLG